MEAVLNSSLGRTTLIPTGLRIGRAPDNTLVISDPQSSSHHAQVIASPDGNSYLITDLQSTNGTFVNEQRLMPNAPRQLNAGDTIRIGNIQFTYEVVGTYTPTVFASSPNYEPTVAATPGAYTPPVPQPPIYNQPQQAYTPPPVYQQPQPVYPQQAYPPVQPGYPQPAYPQIQPGYAQPKKGKAGLWIGLILLLVLIAGGTGAYLVTRSTPQKTLNAYCDGWTKSNAQEIYNQFDSAQQAKGSVSSVQNLLNQLQNPNIGGVKNCTINSVQENGSNAVAIVTLTFGAGHSGSETDTLIQESGTWKIDSSKSNNDFK